MSWTKRELVKAAFRKSGLGGVFANLTASQLQDALFDLDSMMAQWSEKGINLGYVTPVTQGGSSLDDASNVPTWANAAIYLSLAPIIAADLGKQIMPGVLQAGRSAYNTMIRTMAQPIEMQYPNTTPSGQGNKGWRYYDDAFLRTPLDVPLVDPLNTGSASLNRQYSSPDATGFNVAITDGPDSVYLVLTPDAAYAAGTITLPAVANASDNQEVLVISSQAVTALTVAANGAVSVTGAPNTLAANTPFRVRFDASTRIWTLVT